MVHPGILRKKEEEELKSEAEKVVSEGPISLLVLYLIDILASIGQSFISLAKGYRISGSKFIYDAIYKDGSKLIPSAEKYGMIINLKFFHILLSIMLPPLGVFLSRGIYGLHLAVIALILCYINLLFGICFAIVILFIPYYGDRFAKYDYYRILTIRQLINNCNNIEMNDNQELMPLILFSLSVIIIIAIFYIFAKFL